MHKHIENLAGRIASHGWTHQSVNRLIALVEEDGVESPAEESALRTLLARDRFERGARAELSAFLGFIDRAHKKSPHPTLLKTEDIDPARYRRHVEILAGERTTAHPTIPGKKIRFTDRFVPSSKHQLDEVAAWLADYYRDLGFKTHLQPVPWNRHTYANVVVTVPGKTEEKILLCDHYDVADKEHLTARAKSQLSPELLAEREGCIPVGAAVPGADDNASATAALMEAGQVLKRALDSGVELTKTIELVHLVGEELPADCLGARTYLEKARRSREHIAAVIVLDMIGVDRTGNRKMQLSPGSSRASLALAAEVKRSISDLHLELTPVLRPYGSRKSFLHQTDGIHFSKAGIPVVLLNEHVNDDHDRYRAGYHDEFDTTALINFDFAANITRAAVETIYRSALPITNKH